MNMTSTTYFTALLQAVDILADESDKNPCEINGGGNQYNKKAQKEQNFGQIEQEACHDVDTKKFSMSLHNVLERSRRARLKENFDSLRELLPTLSSRRSPSTLSIITEATKVIKELKTEEQYYVDEKTKLQQFRNSLLTKLKSLTNGKEPTEFSELHILLLETANEDQSIPAGHASLSSDRSHSVVDDDVKTMDVGVNTDFPDDLGAGTTIISKITISRRKSTTDCPVNV